jgi:hypothetical protein
MLGQDEQHGVKLANGAMVANGAASDDPPKEPLAELGVAPGGNTPKATITQQPGKPPIVTIAPPAPVLTSPTQPPQGSARRRVAP